MIPLVGALLDAETFEACFLAWIESLSIDIKNEIIAINEKSLRSSHDRKKIASDMLIVVFYDYYCSSLNNERGLYWYCRCIQLLRIVQLRGAKRRSRKMLNYSSTMVLINPGF